MRLGAQEPPGPAAAAASTAGASAAPVADGAPPAALTASAEGAGRPAAEWILVGSVRGLTAALVQQLSPVIHKPL